MKYGLCKSVYTGLHIILLRQIDKCWRSMHGHDVPKDSNPCNGKQKYKNEMAAGGPVFNDYGEAPVFHHDNGHGNGVNEIRRSVQRTSMISEYFCKQSGGKYHLKHHNGSRDEQNNSPRTYRAVYKKWFVQVFPIFPQNKISSPGVKTPSGKENTHSSKYCYHVYVCVSKNGQYGDYCIHYGHYTHLDAFGKAIVRLFKIGSFKVIANVSVKLLQLMHYHHIFQTHPPATP